MHFCINTLTLLYSWRLQREGAILAPQPPQNPPLGHVLRCDREKKLTLNMNKFSQLFATVLQIESTAILQQH